MENYFSAIKIYIQCICRNLVLYCVNRKSSEILFFLLQIITSTGNITVLTNNICMRNRKILVVFGILETLGLLGFGKVFVPYWNTWTSVYRYNEDLELEDAIHTAILTLKVSKMFNKLVSYCFDIIDTMNQTVLSSIGELWRADDRRQHWSWHL